MLKKLSPLLILLPAYSFALNSTGKVNMLEIWRSGNVAFTLTPAAGNCNGQFILNYSDNGSKSMYSTLLAAKMSGKNVRVSYDATCVAPENYGAGNYNQPNYLYVEE